VSGSLLTLTPPSLCFWPHSSEQVSNIVGLSYGYTPGNILGDKTPNSSNFTSVSTVIKTVLTQSGLQDAPSQQPGSTPKSCANVSGMSAVIEWWVRAMRCSCTCLDFLHCAEDTVSQWAARCSAWRQWWMEWIYRELDWSPGNADTHTHIRQLQLSTCHIGTWVVDSDFSVLSIPKRGRSPTLSFAKCHLKKHPKKFGKRPHQRLVTSRTSSATWQAHSPQRQARVTILS